MKNSRIKIKNISNRLILLVIFLSISIFLAFFLPDKVSNHVKNTLSLPAVPFQKASTFAINNFTSFTSRLFSFWKEGEQKEGLEQKILSLQNVVVKQTDIIFKLKSEIKSLADFYELDLLVKPIIANIIGYDAIELKKSIFIDLGSKHGIALNDIVVSGNALVGRISSVSLFTSRVQLITDPEIRVPVHVLETRDHGIIKGTSGPDCQMDYVADTAEVKEGHRVVTSGIGGIYPKSIFVGTIVKCNKKSGRLFFDILVNPSANISKTETVMVIKQMNEQSLL